jgi:hypothetical protein
MHVLFSRAFCSPKANASASWSMIFALSVFLLLVLASLEIVVCAPSKIPYYTGRPLSVDSGYITVDKIRLFYLHVASLKSPSTDPLYVIACDGIY